MEAILATGYYFHVYLIIYKHSLVLLSSYYRTFTERR